MEHNVTLPGGYIDEADVIHRDALVTPFTGKEEELLADALSAVPAKLVTELITRLVKRIGTIAPVTKNIAQQLLVGGSIVSFDKNKRNHSWGKNKCSCSLYG